MATAYWYQSGGDTTWDGVDNWWSDFGHSTPYAMIPQSGDDVILTGSVMPSAAPASPILLNSFDSSSADAGTSYILSNITVGSGGCIIGVSTDATSVHDMSCDLSGASVLTVYGGAIWRNNGGSSTVTTLGVYDSGQINFVSGSLTASGTATMAGSSIWEAGDLGGCASFTMAATAFLRASITSTGSMTVSGAVEVTNQSVTLTSVSGSIAFSGTNANTNTTGNTLTATAATGITISAAATMQGLIVLNVGGVLAISGGSLIADVDLISEYVTVSGATSITLTDTGSTLYALFGTTTTDLTANTNTNVKANITGNVTLAGAAQFTEGVVTLMSTKSLLVQGTAIFGGTATGNATSTVELHSWAALSTATSFIGSGASLTVTVYGASVLTIPSGKVVSLQRVTLDFPDYSTGGGGGAPLIGSGGLVS